MERILERSEEELYQDFLKAWNDATPTVEVQTSGSTGVPKKIKLKKEYMRRSARRTVKFFGLTPESRIMSAMSFKYIGGKMMIVRSLETGCKVAMEQPSLEPLKTIKEDLSLLALVPVQMEYILDNLDKLPKVDHYLIGGSALGDNLRKRIIDAGINAWESYAMTETASHIAIRRVEYDEEGKVKPFYPLEDVILDKDERDRLIIRDGDEEELVTNDIVRFTDDGGFYVLGRADDMIITGGRKILPQTIEEMLAKYIPYEFAISSLPDSKWGERVTLVLGVTGVEDSTASEIINTVEKAIEIIPEEELPRWMRPKAIKVVTEFPRNENGKLRRLELKTKIAPVR